MKDLGVCMAVDWCAAREMFRYAQHDIVSQSFLAVLSWLLKKIPAKGGVLCVDREEKILVWCGAVNSCSARRGMEILFRA